MANIIERFQENFLKNNPFKEIKFPERSSGSLIVKIDLLPSEVFEILETLFGGYEDPHSNTTFVDDKTSWERYILGEFGTYRLYEYRGSTSIGSYGFDIFQKLPPEYTNEANKIKSALENAWGSYLTAKAANLKDEITENPLKNFNRALLATDVLLERARASGSLLEQLVLNAILLDGLLRLSVILAKQIRERTDDFNEEMIYQGASKAKRERDIYNMAKEEGVLGQEELDEINALYDFRNIAIHRFFISGLEYSEIHPFILRYEEINAAIADRVKKLKQTQKLQGIGISKHESEDVSESDLQLIRKEQLLKIDSSIPFAIIPERNIMFRERK